MTTTLQTHLDLTVEYGPLEILSIAVVVFALSFLVSVILNRPRPPKP
jgi:hypothetical protein